MTETESTPDWKTYSGEGGYLTKKGVIKIISVLEDGPKSFGDLNRRINISDNTLSSRLNEGENLNVIKRCPVKTASGRDTLGYGLTERGEEISKIVDDLELVSLLKEKNNLENEIEKRKQLANWKAGVKRRKKKGKSIEELEEKIEELSSNMEL